MTDLLIRTESAPIEPRLCGKVEAALSPLWLMNLVAPEIHEELEKLGLEPTERYFACRAAPLGAVPIPVVVSTFFNFSPVAVSASIPGAWHKASPEQILTAQRTGAGRALDRAFADIDSDIVAETLSLLRPAAEAAADRAEGRPLFAGYASLPWPDEPNLALWHAHYLLREFRGDGHIAVLVAEGLTGIEAVIIHIAMLPFLAPIFRPTRAWSDDEWDAALSRLRADDWLTADEELTLTESGRARRDAIERHTNELNVPAYAVIGTDGCNRLLELAGPISEALNAAGLGIAALSPITDRS